MSANTSIYGEYYKLIINDIIASGDNIYSANPEITLPKLSQPLDLSTKKFDFYEHEIPDIKKFLEFLNCISISGITITNTTAHVVSHSHAMQSFLMKIAEYDKDALTPVFKDNLWTMVAPFSRSLVITRHGYSMANYLKSLESVRQKFSQLTQPDPGLTVWGITTALLRGAKLKEQFGEEDVNTVFVSNLVRTWMTAVCLYLPHLNDGITKFNLIVSPNVNEEGITFDNKPDIIANQLEKFQKFIKVLISEIPETKSNLDTLIRRIRNFARNGGVINLIRYQTLINPESEQNYTINIKENKSSPIAIKLKLTQTGGGLFNLFSRSKKNIGILPVQRETTGNNSNFAIGELQQDNIKIFTGICKPPIENLNRMTKFCEPLSVQFNRFSCIGGRGKLQTLLLNRTIKYIKCSTTQKGGKRKCKSIKKNNK